MEESRAVSDVKIRALALEVEELRPANAALQLEIEALRRHLALAVGELKNPIVLPENYEATDDEEEGSDSGVGDSIDGERDCDFDHDGFQDDVDELMRDLGLFKRKVQDDRERFPHGVEA